MRHNYTYQAFGALKRTTGATRNQYLYRGEKFDETLKNYYLRDRFYDPETSRFTRPDKHEGEILAPFSLHKYVYAYDNPINFSDPTGFFTMGDVSAANSIRNILTQIYVEKLADFLHSVPEAQGLASVFDFANAAQGLLTFAPMMVGAIWTSTSKLSAVQNAFKHWKKHRADFPSLPNSKSFVDFAQDFVSNPPSTALKKTRSNGDIVIYDPASDLFAVSTSSGTPRTLYKPDPSVHGLPSNLDYFNAQ
jgi:RHS repeat-associated protein